MPKQPALPSLGYAMKTKRTRRERFLAEMDAVVPWFEDEARVGQKGRITSPLVDQGRAPAR